MPHLRRDDENILFTFYHVLCKNNNNRSNVMTNDDVEQTIKTKKKLNLTWNKFGCI